MLAGPNPNPRRLRVNVGQTTCSRGLGSIDPVCQAHFCINVVSLLPQYRFLVPSYRSGSMRLPALLCITVVGLMMHDPWPEVAK